MLLKLKNNALEELTKIFKRVLQYNNKIDYTSSNSTRTINGLDDFSKDELIEKIIKLRCKRNDGQLIPSGEFDLSVPSRTGFEHYEDNKILEFLYV